MMNLQKYQKQDYYTYQRPTENETIALLVSLGYRPYLFQSKEQEQVLIWSKTEYREDWGAWPADVWRWSGVRSHAPVPTQGRVPDARRTADRIREYLGDGAVTRLPASLDVLRPWFDSALVLLDVPDQENRKIVIALGEGLTSGNQYATLVGS